MPLVTLKQRQKEYSTIFDIWLIIYRVPCFRLQYGTTFDWGLLTAIRIVVVTDRMINCWYMHKRLRKRWWFNLTTKIYLITDFWKPKYDENGLLYLYFYNNCNHYHYNEMPCSYLCSRPDNTFNTTLFRVTYALKLNSLRIHLKVGLDIKQDAFSMSNIELSRTALKCHQKRNIFWNVTSAKSQKMFF